MIDTPQILETEAIQTAVIHLHIPHAEMRTAMGPGIAELMAAVGAQGITPSGRWFTRHFKFEPGMFDFEISIPVPRPVTAVGRVKPSVLPATTVARTIYHGGYEGLAGAWPQLDAWIKAQGRTPSPSLWEVYVTDPQANPDPGTWRTELNRPLIG